MQEKVCVLGEVQLWKSCMPIATQAVTYPLIMLPSFAQAW